METPEQRSERGREMARKANQGGVWIVDVNESKGTMTADISANADWAYHASARKPLTSSERATFDLEFIRARAVAGVRPAVDLALAAMRTKLMQRLGTPTWRAG